MDTITEAPRLPHGAVIQRYRGQDRVSANQTRLMAVVALFRLSPSEIAKATGFSRCYVSRLLSRGDDFTGSPEFFRTLELRLGTIIEGRSSQFFTVRATPVFRARRILEALPAEELAEPVTLARAA